MFCKRCGSPLPSTGFVCKNCGAMMDKEQIIKQKEYIKENNKERMQVELLSDKYSNNKIKRDYSREKENKILGLIIIVCILTVLIIIAIFKLCK